MRRSQGKTAADRRPSKRPAPTCGKRLRCACGAFFLLMAGFFAPGPCCVPAPAAGEEAAAGAAAGIYQALVQALVPVSIVGAAVTVLLLLFNRRLQKEVRERKRSEEALRENERRLLDIIEFLPDATFVVDRRHRVIAWNSAMETMTGLSKEEILGEGAFAYAVPFYGERRPVLIDLIMDREADPHTLYPYLEERNDRLLAEIFLPRLRGGQGAYVTATASPLYNRNGKLVGAIESIRDVTDRKAAERALKESEEKYRGVLESIAEGYFEVDLAGNLTFFNRALCEISGFPAEELMGKNNRTYTTAETAKRLFEVFNTVYRTGISSSVTDIEILRKDGKLRFLEFSVQLAKDEDGQPSGFRGVARDTTERRRAQEALKESKDLFDTFMRNLPALAFMKDEQGRYIYFNEAAQALLKDVSDLGIGKTDPELWPEEIARRLHANDAEVLQGGVGISRVETLTFGGHPRDYLVSKFPIVRDSGPDLLAGIALDMTDSVRAEREKKELQARLLQAQKMEAVGNLAGGIAHDFNNILAAILGHTELALLSIPDESPVRRHLEGVSQAGRRAKDLIQQILSFSRQGAHEMQPVQIAPIVKEGVKLLKASLPATIEIRARIDAEAPVVEADPTQIHQVLMNLCTNAAHAMGQNGGVLSVVLDVAPPDKTPPGSGGRRFLRLQVADTGTGIDPAHLDRIFEPYFTTKEKEKGTGLGLAVVHGIVESHKGLVEVSSQPGEGTVFDLFFPVVDVPAAVRPPAGQKPASGSGRVLLVDDEKELVDVVGQMIERLGYTVTTATESDEALNMFRRRPDDIDLLITDMTMPKMTGDRLAAEMRRIRPDLPAILCTGYSELIDEERARRQGFRAFLVKPISLQVLAEGIRAALPDAGG